MLFSTSRSTRPWPSTGANCTSNPRQIGPLEWCRPHCSLLGPTRGKCCQTVCSSARQDRPVLGRPPAQTAHRTHVRSDLLNGADLIVRCLDRHEVSVVRQYALQHVKIDPSLAVHRRKLHIEPTSDRTS